jgi:acylphosphatase
MKHYNIRVHGRVQGVFYRANTVRKATELGLTGWVKNEPDGSVLISAEGIPQSLDRLIEWCEHGPEYARVTRVDYYESKLMNFDTFTIIR